MRASDYDENEPCTSRPAGAPKGSLRTMLVAASEVFRIGLRAVLSRYERELVIVAQRERLEVGQVTSVLPDLLFVDIDAPGANPILAGGELQRAAPTTRVVVLGSFATYQQIDRVLTAGASGYVGKEQPVVGVLAALDRILERKINWRRRGGTSPTSEAGVRTLSNREREVFDRVIWGASSKAIAAALRISVKTVETHRVHINSKLGAHSAADLVRLASLAGLLGSGTPLPQSAPASK